MRSLNFYPGNYHPNLESSRKQGTIRLGDKTQKYSESDIVWVTVGKHNSKRMKVFTAVIDRVTVKRIAELTREDLHCENPEISGISEMITFLSMVYNQKIIADQLVSVIYFSEIVE